MKKTIYLIIFILLASTALAQNKKLTLYYPDSTKVLNISGLDSMSIFICGASKVNFGSKAYNTVLIGNQCWLKENLDIGIMTSPSNNGAIEKYCYNNLLANCETYGGLYTWNEAMQYVTTEGAQGICPDGWHIPTVAEVQTLVNYVGNDGNAYKNEDQGSGAGQGTNTSGFSALLNGGRQGGTYSGLGDRARLFISKQGSCGYSCLNTLEFDATTNNTYFGQGAMTNWAMAVRCIKN
jgi:uncharacterized protein (TIGR02145 family)